jgi:DNA topoisomerase I
MSRPMPRLRHVDCAEPGYGRRRSGRGFVYLDTRGERLRDPDEVERIKELAIPPAWTDVWICRAHNGHLQAVGTDSAGRRQYLYHPAWRERRDRQKFDEMLAFARALPKLRRRSAQLLNDAGPTKDRVLGFAVTLLDRGLFRVGSEEYAEGNGSYGLTTLERRHVQLLSNRTVVFDYVGKTGRNLVHTINDRRLRAVAEELKDRPGRSKAFLAFLNGKGWAELRAADINAFIKDVTGGDYSAKDFRTWHATVLAAASLAHADGSSTAAGRKRAINAAAADVADVLGNTPAIAKKSYIDPRVFDRYLSGTTISPGLGRREIERAVIALLEA